MPASPRPGVHPCSLQVSTRPSLSRSHSSPQSRALWRGSSSCLWKAVCPVRFSGSHVGTPAVLLPWPDVAMESDTALYLAHALLTTISAALVTAIVVLRHKLPAIKPVYAIIITTSIFALPTLHLLPPRSTAVHLFSARYALFSISFFAVMVSCLPWSKLVRGAQLGVGALVVTSTLCSLPFARQLTASWSDIGEHLKLNTTVSPRDTYSQDQYAVIFLNNSDQDMALQTWKYSDKVVHEFLQRWPDLIMGPQHHAIGHVIHKLRGDQAEADRIRSEIIEQWNQKIFDSPKRDKILEKYIKVFDEEVEKLLSAMPSTTQ